MNNKCTYLIAILSVGFLFLVFNTHKPVQIETELSPEWWRSREPYFSLLDQCHGGTVPDNYACVYKLADSTLGEANTLAQQLIQNSPANKTKQIPEFYEVLPTKVRAVQKIRDNYLDAFCDLDSALIYGGTGSTSEREACRYFYAEKYLDLLKRLEK